MADIGRSFEDIKTALLGTTILPQPRVSRDVSSKTIEYALLCKWD